MEIERKYLIRYPDEAVLRAMPGCQVWEIRQTYLIAPSGVTRRVRALTERGEARYFYAEKRPVTGEVCDERERGIDRGEYEALLQEANPGLNTIEKRRLRIPWSDHICEIDLYPFWKRQAVLEIELAREGEIVAVPDWLTVIRDVTWDGAYKNRALARHVPEEEAQGFAQDRALQLNFSEAKKVTIKTVEKNGATCAVVNSDDIVIKDAPSALDVLMSAKYEAGTSNIVISKKLVANDFFILSTGLAGEILQKYVNYGGRIAIYGDYSHYTSKPLKDFMYESNKGRDVFFVETEAEAIAMLTR